MFPASTGEHRGRHYCVGCTVSIDDQTAFVDWPCDTALAAAAGYPVAEPVAPEAGR